MTIVVFRDILCIILVYLVFFTHFEFHNKRCLIFALIITSLALNSALIIGYVKLMEDYQGYFWTPFILEEITLHFFVPLGIFLKWIFWPKILKKYMLEFYM